MKRRYIRHSHRAHVPRRPQSPTTYSHPASPYRAAYVRPMAFKAEAVVAGAGDNTESHGKDFSHSCLGLIGGLPKLVHDWT
jgi:hypothetical protein